MDISELLAFAIKNNASDLHLSADMQPMLRVDGDLRKINIPALEHKEILSMLYDVMNDKQQKQFENDLQLDFSFEIKNLSRFRVNAFQQNRGAGGVFRTIPCGVVTLKDLGVPKILTSIANERNGIILVTGPTGSGKSTTLAAMIDHINSSRHQHILTIEDPIEFIHKSNQCLINQREVHRDTHSFSDALRAALREDPDIILVGEMRDIETIRLALTAAETGHLVMATLHTSSAAKTINRIIDVFPAEEKNQIRSMLSESLKAVIAQTLLKRVDKGRIAAIEILINNSAIKNLIREDKIAQIYSSIQTGGAQGMQTLDQHLQYLTGQRAISMQTAYETALMKEAFQHAIL